MVVSLGFGLVKGKVHKTFPWDIYGYQLCPTGLCLGMA